MMTTTVNVSAEIQDGCGKDEQRIEKIKMLKNNFDKF